MPDATETVILAERALLGAMLNDPAIAKHASTLLAASHFHLVSHQKVFGALVSLNGDAGPIPVINLLQGRQELELVGGFDGVFALLDARGAPANLEPLATIIRDASARRSVRHAAWNVLERFPDPSVSTADLRAILAASEPQAATSGPHLTPLDLNGDPAPTPWLLEPWMIEQDIGLFCGPPGEGKSTTIAAIAIAMASGMPPFTNTAPSSRICPVIYLDVEMGEQSTRRTFRRLMAGMGLDAAPEPLLVISAPGELSLASATSTAQILATVTEWAKTYSALGPPVLFVDTLSGSLSGIDSFNDAALIEPVYRTLFKWRDSIGLTTILSHHPRKRGQWETGAPTLDQVRDSTTHTAKCSVVWFAQKPARSARCIDVYTLKNRGRDPARIQRIGYQSLNSDSAIHLSLEQSPEPEAEGEVERTEKLVADFIHLRGDSGAKNSDIYSFTDSQNIKQRTAKRAIASLVALKVITKFARGHYRTTQSEHQTLLDQGFPDE